jgi:hypothetical protein
MALHPMFGYLLLLGFTAVWALTPSHPQAVALTVLFLPSLFFVLGILNLPLLGSAFRKLWLPLPVRRNHALEHGTIQMLYRKCGVTRGFGGRAAPGGFRLSGVRNQHDIKRAFADFVALPHDQRLQLAVANRCGSMIVVSQGLGIFLILATLLAVAIWRPQPRQAGILLAGQLLVFVLGRGPLGRLLQARRLLALDFSSARIQRINRVEPRLREKPPVFFVHTEIDLVR